MGIARYVTAHAPTQGADAGMYDAFSEIHKLSTVTKQTFISFDKFSALNSLKSISYKSIDKKVTFSYMSCITYML